MTLQTGIRWIDSELKGEDAVYIRSNSTSVRAAILQRAITTNTGQQRISLLSFSSPRNGYWSQDIEQALTENNVVSALQAGDSTIARIGRHGTPIDQGWEQLHEHRPELVIADQVTNLKVDSLHGDVTPLERTADQLRELHADAALLILDRNPPYRPLTDVLASTVTIRQQEDLLKARIAHSDQGTPREKTVGLGTSQKSIGAFTEALAT